MKKDPYRSQRGCFKSQAVVPGAEKWAAATARRDALYQRDEDIRTPFGRDYTRILHSSAYRRLKYKTQVFFRPRNDHVSTRIDHVHYVASIGRLIADFLGLNGELTEAIAIGHDLGHTPFGHDGEAALSAIVRRDGLAPAFWHAANGLRFVDDFELLSGPDGRQYNLDLTYAVRDGIVGHSGPVNDALFPREDAIDLSQFARPGQFNPFTWEGCIIKIADNISYLGRDIDDAVLLGLMKPEDRRVYAEVVDRYARAAGVSSIDVNNANVIHLMVTDLCLNSTPERGMGFSEPARTAIGEVTRLNRELIYFNDRLKAYKDYGHQVIETIYAALCRYAEEPGRRDYFREQFPSLTVGFEKWLIDYMEGFHDEKRADTVACHWVYTYQKGEAGAAEMKRAAVDYISGMTDRFIELLYREQVVFKSQRTPYVSL
ncbi:MAG: deoxyguanosinetriphosphate triphosphohydrolase family protein [Pseudoramibacter sp.]|jgi:dGTPase